MVAKQQLEPHFHFVTFHKFAAPIFGGHLTLFRCLHLFKRNPYLNSNIVPLFLECGGKKEGGRGEKQNVVIGKFDNCCQQKLSSVR